MGVSIWHAIVVIMISWPVVIVREPLATAAVVVVIMIARPVVIISGPSAAAAAVVVIIGRSRTSTSILAGTIPWGPDAGQNAAGARAATRDIHAVIHCWRLRYIRNAGSSVVVIVGGGGTLATGVAAAAVADPATLIDDAAASAPALGAAWGGLAVCLAALGKGGVVFVASRVRGGGEGEGEDEGEDVVGWEMHGCRGVVR